MRGLSCFQLHFDQQRRLDEQLEVAVIVAATEHWQECRARRN